MMMLPLLLRDFVVVRRMVKNLLFVRNLNYYRWYSSGGRNIEDIKKEFREFDGGRINLKKDSSSGIACVEIDFPEKKNGFSGKMMAELHDSIMELEQWDQGRALLLYGASNYFSSGGYLPTVRGICSKEGALKMATLMQDSLIRLSRVPLVSVSLICGKALGGGAELCLATDFRLMGRGAEIKFVEARMGVCTGWGGGTLLKRIVGGSRALELLLSCRSISVEEGMGLGLVHGVIDDSDDENGAVKFGIEWVSKLVGHHDLEVVRGMKRIVSGQQQERQEFEWEKQVFSGTWGGDAQRKILDGIRKGEMVVKHNS